jgi:hypothetical protein
VFYAGLGLLLLASTFWLAERRLPITSGLLEWHAVIGRASLFAFVLQYFLYWTLPDLLGLVPNRWCLLLFAGNVLVLRWAAMVWGRVRGNSRLTFGIRLARRST